MTTTGKESIDSIYHNGTECSGVNEGVTTTIVTTTGKESIKDQAMPYEVQWLLGLKAITARRQ